MPRCHLHLLSVFATSKGEPTLEEETGKSFTAGVVWDITDALSVAVDYYDIKLEGAIANLSSTFILDAEGGCRTGLTRTRQPYQFDINSAFCQEIISRVTRTPAIGEPTDRVTEIRSGPVNQSYERVTGIDASVKYHLDTDRFGDYNFGLEWSHRLANETQTFATDPIDKEFRDDPGNFDFRSRIRGSVNWSRNDWAATLFMSRYGSTPNWQETGRVAPYFLWNTNVTKKITDKLTRDLLREQHLQQVQPARRWVQHLSVLLARLQPGRSRDLGPAAVQVPVIGSTTTDTKEPGESRALFCAASRYQFLSEFLVGRNQRR